MKYFKESQISCSFQVYSFCLREFQLFTLQLILTIESVFSSSLTARQALYFETARPFTRFCNDIESE